MPSDYSMHASSPPNSVGVVAADSIGDNEWRRAPLPPSAELELKAEIAPATTTPLAGVEAEAEASPGPEAAGPIKAAPAEEPLTLRPLPEPLSLEALVESLLFVAEAAVPITRLAEALEVRPAQVEAALESLARHYTARGLRLQRIKDKVQLTTAPAAAERVQRFLGLAASAPLSKAALETLAIIAYQQPVTRPQVEAIRGVNSDSVIKNLLSKGLIEEAGRTEGPGRPVLYITTPEFLQHFGLASLEELPPLNLDGLKREPGTEIPKG